MHGPLTALLIDFARDRQVRAHVPHLHHAGAGAALRDHAPFELRGRPTPDGHGAELWAVTPNGTVAMSAQATFV